MKLSKEEMEERRHRIRRLLRRHLKAYEIIAEMKISRATYCRHIRVIRQQDMKEMERLRRDGFAHDFRLAIDSLEEQIQQLAVIRAQAEESGDKIRATEVIAKLEIDILSLKGYLPEVMADAVERAKYPQQVLGHRIPA